MPRVLKLTPRFLARRSALGEVARTPALYRALTALETDDLPRADDFEIGIPPTGRAWARRVPGHNLWLLFRFDANTAIAIGLVSFPPIPLD